MSRAPELPPEYPQPRPAPCTCTYGTDRHRTCTLALPPGRGLHHRIPPVPKAAFAFALSSASSHRQPSSPTLNPLTFHPEQTRQTQACSRDSVFCVAALSCHPGRRTDPSICCSHPFKTGLGSPVTVTHTHAALIGYLPTALSASTNKFWNRPRRPHSFIFDYLCPLEPSSWPPNLCYQSYSPTVLWSTVTLRPPRPTYVP